MKVPTEPIGSIPRPVQLIEAIAKAGDFADPKLDPLFEEAIRDTIEKFESTGSPVITDGEQRKYHNFWTYSVHGMQNTAPDGFRIPFSAGHVRRMPRLTAGPFRYRVYADRLMVQVRDSGKGIPKEKQVQLTASGRSGVGFGGMRERVRQLGGTLEIHSEGDGTVVSVILKVE